MNRYGAGRRPIHPPPICKKALTPPILTPRPKGAIIAVFTGLAIDEWDSRLQLAERHFLYQYNEWEWQSEPWPGLPGSPLITFELDEDFNDFQFCFTLEASLGFEGFYESGFIPITEAIPFRFTIQPTLPPGWTGDLKVELEQYS